MKIKRTFFNSHVHYKISAQNFFSVVLLIMGIGLHFNRLEGESSLGMETGAISDGQITASSYWGQYHESFLARLHLQEAWSQFHGSWSAGSNDVNQWLQIDLSIEHKITRVATQGRKDANQWVTKYNLHYSANGVTFQYYTDQYGLTKVALRSFLSLLARVLKTNWHCRKFSDLVK